MSPFQDFNSEMLGPVGLVVWIVILYLLTAACMFAAWLYRAMMGKNKSEHDTDDRTP